MENYIYSTDDLKDDSSLAYDPKYLSVDLAQLGLRPSQFSEEELVLNLKLSRTPPRAPRLRYTLNC